MGCRRFVALMFVLACGTEKGDGELGDEGETAETPAPSDASTTGHDAATAESGSEATGLPDPSTGPGEETGPPPVLPDPILPEPMGECPDFMAGDQMIGDLETMIVAGAPGETKGPLILYWHGTGSSPGIEVPLFLTPDQQEEIVAEGGLIVAPKSNGQDRGGFSPNGVWYEEGDLAWADQIVACAIENHNIDPRRIYTTGCSAGGLMSGGVALKRSNYIAAATPNSGGIIIGGTEIVQNPETLPAIMTMHGGTSDTVIVNFGATSANLDKLVVEMGGFAVDCNHMSGHCGIPDPLRAAAWEFMKAHPFGTDPSPHADGLPETYPAYCEIWDGSS